MISFLSILRHFKVSLHSRSAKLSNMWHVATGKGCHITRCTICIKGHLPTIDTSLWSRGVCNSQVPLYTFGSSRKQQHLRKHTPGQRVIQPICTQIWNTVSCILGTYTGTCAPITYWKVVNTQRRERFYVIGAEAEMGMSPLLRT